MFRDKSKESILKIEYILPERIVVSHNTEFVEALLEDAPMQTSFNRKGACVIKKGGSVLIDFGVEIAGGIELTTVFDLKIPSAKLRIVFGESVSEALSSVGEKNSGNYHSIRDTVIDVAPYSTFSFGSTGFRFVKLEAVDNDICIQSLRAALKGRDIPLLGSFECSDEKLNKIWQTAVYTVYLNMQEYIYDGIKRDRLVWVGDMYPEVKTILAAFGDDITIKNSLDMVKKEWEESVWMNKIPTYTLWWVKIHRDLYYYTGDKEYLKEQEAFIEKVLLKLSEHISSSGELSFDKYFTDWSTLTTDDLMLSFTSCLVMGLDAMKDIFSELGNKNYIVCEDLKKCVLKKIPECYGSKQAAGISVFSGACDAIKMNEEILSKNPLSGLSTFYGYFVLIAKAMAGDIKGAVDVMKGYWGKMIDVGATTFWEEFDLEWTKDTLPITEVVPEGKKHLHGDFGCHCYEGLRLSLCHGWASGPAPFMTEYILGIKILEPGCKKIKIEPQLGDLSYAKGTYPTPYGNISVYHKIENGEIKTEVIAPDEIEIIK